jgi:hypothetical protein
MKKKQKVTELKSRHQQGLPSRQGRGRHTVAMPQGPVVGQGMGMRKHMRK